VKLLPLLPEECPVFVHEGQEYEGRPGVAYLDGHTDSRYLTLIRNDDGDLIPWPIACYGHVGVAEFPLESAKPLTQAARDLVEWVNS